MRPRALVFDLYGEYFRYSGGTAKLATLTELMGVLGATGQGLPSDLPLATAYLGPGPWGSLAAGIASQPSQVSPLPGPPQMRGMGSFGKRPAAIFS